VDQNNNAQTGAESISIDPVRMNIVNRIASGTRFVGTIECEGGLLIEGQFSGTASVVNGPLVLLQAAVFAGDINCSGDAFLFGTVEEKADGSLSELVCGGAVFMAETLIAKANVTAAAFKTYDGAQVEGRIKTVRKVDVAGSKA
jgi:hypothetical protein